MSEELLVNVTPQETRVALVENGGLQELHTERSRSRGIVANIYKGKVVRVLPGMQAAFVELKACFRKKLRIFVVSRPQTPFFVGQKWFSGTKLGGRAT